MHGSNRGHLGKEDVISDTRKFLIIEDEEPIRGILTAFVERYAMENTHHFRPKTMAMADSVRGLFELSQSGEDYSAVLLDVRLPRMTGDEVFAALEIANPSVIDKIIFITGYSCDLDGRFPDVDLKVLEKPFKYNDFSQMLDRVMVSTAA
ncbi:MAG: response regulator [Mariprofundaceae bacterium]